MKLSRDKIQRMIDVGSGGSSGGVSSSELAGLLSGYATESWVDEHYISIDFFSRLFQAHGTENGSEIDVMPNDMDTAITSVESMFGFWTNLYISALGSNGAAPAGISLGMLTDVAISGTPSAGQVLTYDAVSGKWVNGNAQAGATALANLTDVLLSQVQNGDTLLYDSTTSKWYNSALKTINGQSLLGSGDISVGGGASGNYLPLSGGKLVGRTIMDFDPTRFPSSFFIKSATTNTGLGFGNSESTKNAVYLKFKSTSYDSSSNSNRLDVDFYGNDSVFSITAGGDVGIGKTAPDGRLHVEKAEASLSSDVIRSVNTSRSMVNLRIFTGLTPFIPDGCSAHIYAGIANTNYNGGYFGFHRVNFGGQENYITLGLYNADDIIICTGYGRVGMGTTSPSARLEVISSLSSTSWVSDGGQIRCGAAGTSYFIGMSATSNGYGVIQSANVGTGAISLLLNPSGGNVGIGSSASYKLHVEGTIYATGSITALSDARKKDITGEAGVTVEQIAHAPAVQFLWKDEERRKDGQQVGTLAQYWRTVLPEVVSDKGGELSMQYGVAALVSSIIIARKVANHEVRIDKMEKWMKKWAEENDE